MLVRNVNECERVLSKDSPARFIKGMVSYNPRLGNIVIVFSVKVVVHYRCFSLICRTMNSDTVFDIPRVCYHFITVNVYENNFIFVKRDDSKCVIIV